MVYSALDREFAFPILSSFERSTDGGTSVIAKYDVESTKTVGLVNLIIAEQRSPNCDLFWNNEIMHTVRLQKLGLLEPRNWNVESGYPSNMIASDGSWCGFAARARVLIGQHRLDSGRPGLPQFRVGISRCTLVEKMRDGQAVVWNHRNSFCRPARNKGRDDTIEMLTVDP